MGNRYTNESGDPRELYDDSGRSGRDFGDRERGRRFNDTTNRRNPSFEDRSSHGGENYFGSGRMGYGDGVEDYEPNHSFGSSWRDSTGESNYENTDKRYDSTRRRAGFGRDAYGIGYGGDWEPEANRRRFENRDYDRNHQNSGYSSRNRYSRDYPSSESGFSDRGSNYDRGDRSWWDRAADEVSSWFGGEADRGSYGGRSQSHRGRGPKNYTRSDERIQEDINDRLTDHDYLDASEIDVTVHSGEVVLTGTVNSRREKRMAEDIVEDISGVKNVENRIRVTDQQNNYAGRNWGYGNVTGHTELNRQEVNATQGETPTQDQSRSATNKS